MSLRMPNTCFVHIPRTGGMWMKKVAENLGLIQEQLNGDIDSHYAYRELSKGWKELRAFTFIRHPFLWVRSRWSHAIEINAYAEYRHHGIHRLFDECIKETLEETIITIIKEQPKLVLRTFSEMANGVTHIFQTRKLPENIYPFFNIYEGISREKWDTALCERINSTTTLDKYKGKLEVSSTVMNEFLDSESETIKWWESCG